MADFNAAEKVTTSANLTGSAVSGVIAWGSIGVGGLPRRIGVIRIPISRTKDAPHLNAFRRSPTLTLAGLGIDEVAREVGAYLYGGVGDNFAGLWGPGYQRLVDFVAAVWSVKGRGRKSQVGTPYTLEISSFICLFDLIHNLSQSPFRQLCGTISKVYVHEVVGYAWRPLQSSRTSTVFGVAVLPLLNVRVQGCPLPN